MLIKIHTDGSCNNGKKGRLRNIGGYACIVDTPDNKRCILMGGEIQSSSARMELAAVMSSLVYINKYHYNKYIKLNIYTDAEYIANSFNKGWLERWIEEKWMFTKNTDLWKVIVAQLSTNSVLSISVNHVKGHSGIELNELADKYAEEARQLMNQFHSEKLIKCYNRIDTGKAVIYKYNEL